jgi:hypothetical protein
VMGYSIRTILTLHYYIILTIHLLR